LYQKTAAVRARLSYRFAIYGELAFGKLAAPIKYPLLLADSSHKLAAALGARNPDFDQVGHGRFTVRIATTREKFAETSDLYDHGSTAFRTCLLAGLSHVDLFQVCPSFIQHFLEGGIELLQNSYPFMLTLGYFVQLFFHLGCETRVNDFGEMRSQNFSDR
jgi:hypothetical protein